MIPTVNFIGETQDVYPEVLDPPDITIVTSFNRTLWDRYAKDCFESWLKFFPKTGIKFKIWLDGEWPLLPFDSRINYNQLDVEEFFLEYVHKYSNVRPPDVEKIPRNQIFRWNHVPFWCKVFALTQELVEAKPNSYVIWLDADVLLTDYVDPRKEWLPWVDDNKLSIVWLARGEPWNYGETGWMMFKASQDTTDFAGDLRATYMTGAIFDYREWHDAFIISSLFKKYSAGVAIGTINNDPSALHPFTTSPLAPKLVHKKGLLKDENRTKEDKPEKPLKKLESVLDGY